MNKPDVEVTAQTLKRLNQLAIEAVRSKNYKQALDYFMQSLVLEEKLGLKAQMAESFYNLASVYFLQEEYDQALRKIQFAITLFEQENKTEDAAKAKAMQMELKRLLSTENIE